MSSERWSGRDIRQRANDILDAIAAIRSFTVGMTEAAFGSDRKTRSAVERELLTISEATAKMCALQEQAQIPEELLLEQRFPAVQWAAIRGIGNILRHEYGRVDPKVIWETVRNDEHLNRLESAVEEFLRL